MNITFMDQKAEIVSEVPTTEIMKNIERMARVCFQSRENPKTNETFVMRIVKNKHESVLEHFNITVKFTIDRAMSHALVRHRHCAFTQESTHYIDYTKKEEGFCFIYPVNLVDKNLFIRNISKQMGLYQEFYSRCGKHAARVMLPMALKTDLLVTTNIREWRHIFKLRLAFDHPQMMDLLKPLLYDFQKTMPILFGDIVI